MNEKNRKSAMEAAYSYLDTRMRTKAEVERRLKEKGYTEDDGQDHGGLDRQQPFSNKIFYNRFAYILR